MKLTLTKSHGCGNDFVLMHAKDVRDIPLEPLIRAVCDRRTGVGADGFILAETDPLTMRFYNADGSAAPMCGNGIRCFARFCLEEGLTDSDSFPVQTGAGEKQVEIVSRAPFLARIAMGKPDYRPEMVGAAPGTNLWDYTLDAGGARVTLCSFFLSTVHTVWFVDDAADDALLPLAEKIHSHPMFAAKTNVNLVEVIDDATIRMRTWERGVGPTLACGTGACSAVLAAYKKGLCGPDVTVRLPRGELYISVAPDESVTMTGPAQRILKGEYEYEG